MSGGVGRPRASGATASSQDAKRAVLEAAAELFTTTGYAATTTRAIAERAGLRQASLYYHFPAKEDILCALLAETVHPSLEVARTLIDARADVGVRLWALTYSDARLLGTARHNLGVLYLLPEIASPGLALFRAERAGLKAAYGKLIERIPDDAPAATRTDLVFGLVESIAVMRRDEPDRDIEAHSRHCADGVLRLAGHPRLADEQRSAALSLLDTPG
ncbi:TetR/AcrR family transcriptional regulator [Kibdelosporangium phytohabitans]|uniref:TetR family transcriptional regulator n=1 Tax=Kibdelosporangium phytohabitans TaxID=860235 RepID=A0A0N9I0R5_9PSEU|nr:TetR/AcrR family transcriptional regulator [Kibdelosporangium phytohabitans]ALG09257.1 TetR family transcriptional regulator [Kibdelosporangium phytohabitans]MBE1469499.1 AcrR family transcriptional regulator [Kibdelosporangium phytohabitans]